MVVPSLSANQRITSGVNGSPALLTARRRPFSAVSAAAPAAISRR